MSEGRALDIRGLRSETVALEVGPMADVLAVHLSSHAITQRNWRRVGLPQHVWGFKQWRPDYDHSIEYVVFSIGVTGGPRQPLADWRNQRMQEVYVAPLIDIYEADDALWLDEAPPVGIRYPVRLVFGDPVEARDVPMDGQGVLGIEICDALRASGISNRGYRVQNVDRSDLRLPATPPAASAGRISTVPSIHGSGQGRGRIADPALKKAVEARAETVAEQWYRAQPGVTAVKRYGAPFDLEVTQDAMVIHVEVKGSITTFPNVELTENEVRHAQDVASGRPCEHSIVLPHGASPCARTDLFLVTGIAVDRFAVPPRASGGSAWRSPSFDPTGHIKPTRHVFTPGWPDPIATGLREV